MFLTANRRRPANAAVAIAGMGLLLLSLRPRGGPGGWQRSLLSQDISAAFDVNLWGMYGDFCNDRKKGCDKAL